MMASLRGAIAVLGVGLAAFVTVPPRAVRAFRQQPVFRAGVDHVAVDVIATDSDHKPVADLKQSDFRITEGDRPQTIADFAYVSIPSVHRTIDGAAVAAAPLVDVAENAPPSPTSRIWVMVVDDVHILPQFIPQVKQVMTEFLRSLSPQDEVAITFVSRSDLSQNFTTDLGRLVKAVNSVRAAFGFGYGADAMTAASALGARGIGSPYAAPHLVLQAAQSAVYNLRNAATTLANSGHARRAIVYVSAQSVLDVGAPIDGPEFTAARAYQGFLQEAFDAARRADVPVYTLDPRGLAQPETATKGHCCSSYQQRTEVQRRIVIQQDWLSSIATNTGGLAFINRNDLTRAVDEIVSDNSSYYLLGYYPDPFVRDGKFHDIKVTVGRPGVHLRAKTGYVAPAANAEAATTTATLASVMSAGFNVSGLSVRSFAAPIAPTKTGTIKVLVTIEVTLPSITAGESSSDRLHWQVMALDPDGKVKGSIGNAAPITLSPAGSHVVMNDVIELPSQPLTIRVGVTSEALGKSGSVQLPAIVPDMSNGKLQIASVVLGVVDGRGKSAAEPESLKTLVPFQPTAARAFATTDTLQVFAPVFWSGRDAGAHAIVSIRRGADVVVSHDEEIQGTSMNGDHRTATVRADLPLLGLTLGSYTLTVDVQLPNTQGVTHAVPFEVK
jgi:VWFA-related protein